MHLGNSINRKVIADMGIKIIQDVHLVRVNLYRQADIPTDGDNPYFETSRKLPRLPKGKTISIKIRMYKYMAWNQKDATEYIDADYVAYTRYKFLAVDDYITYKKQPMKIVKVGPENDAKELTIYLKI